MKKRKKKIVVGTIIIIVLYNLYLRTPYTFKKEYKIINYALQGNRDYFGRMQVNLDEKEKTVEYLLTDKSKTTMESYAILCGKMNEYLKNNPDYFLNNGYHMELNFYFTNSYSPVYLSFSNEIRIKWSDRVENLTERGNKLNCMSIKMRDEFDVYKIKDSSHYDFVEYMDIGVPVITEGKVLNNFKSLKKVFLSYSDVTWWDKEQLRRDLDNCEVE
ncbi:hypothetical protein SAMN02745248_02383 [Hathewaya proteolytica DSM 3090]|uniref:Uncharacterized protein n=1 Tax=Hathewaya proteolytica DSM 3090 TaxID=1121331 RepID=A0A1M6RVU5_9CLOT|nr:hypothetical protein [Hathewaya proteolytica]SHK36427.1 hypothetical protein SAMN02745248_02383 [Hathewaya proteolytica DSM 3090]